MPSIPFGAQSKDSTWSKTLNIQVRIQCTPFRKTKKSSWFYRTCSRADEQRGACAKGLTLSVLSAVILLFIVQVLVGGVRSIALYCARVWGRRMNALHSALIVPVRPCASWRVDPRSSALVAALEQIDRQLSQLLIKIIHFYFLPICCTADTS